MMINTKISIDLLFLLQLFQVGILKVKCTAETPALPRYEYLNYEICLLIENQHDNKKPSSYNDPIKESTRLFEKPNKSVILDIGGHEEAVRSDHLTNKRRCFLVCAFCCICFIVVSLVFVIMTHSCSKFKKV